MRTVVIPVLVGGATLPRKGDLPPDLQALTDQHAVTVTTNGFRNEMAGLARDIRAIPGPLPWGMIGGGTAAALALVLGGWVGAYQLGVPVWVPSVGRVEPARPDAARRAVDVEVSRRRPTSTMPKPLPTRPKRAPKQADRRAEARIGPRSRPSEGGRGGSGEEEGRGRSPAKAADAETKRLAA